MAKKLWAILAFQTGSAGNKTSMMLFTNHTAAAKKMNELLAKAKAQGAYTSPIHHTDWGKYTDFHPMTIDAFHASHKCGTESSVELREITEGEMVVPIPCVG